MDLFKFSFLWLVILIHTRLCMYISTIVNVFYAYSIVCFMWQMDSQPVHSFVCTSQQGSQNKPTIYKIEDKLRNKK